jgi:hypothetical protein
MPAATALVKVLQRYRTGLCRKVKALRRPGMREAQAELAEREDSNTPVLVTARGSATYETKPLRTRIYGLHSVAAGCAGFRLSVLWRGHNLVTRAFPSPDCEKGCERRNPSTVLTAVRRRAEPVRSDREEVLAWNR